MLALTACGQEEASQVAPDGPAKINGEIIVIGDCADAVQFGLQWTNAFRVTCVHVHVGLVQIAHFLFIAAFREVPCR